MPPIVDIRRLAVFVVLLIMNEKERNPMPLAVSEGICVARPRSNPKLLMPRQKMTSFQGIRKRRERARARLRIDVGLIVSCLPPLLFALR